MNLKTKIRTSLIILIAAVFSLIFFLIYPFFNDIKKSSSGILEQKQKLLLLESKVENLGKFKNRSREIAPDFKKTEALFIKADLPIDFIRFLEKTAKDSNIEIQLSLSSGLFQIALQGSFPDFLRFLERLQNSQYLIEVGNLNVSRQEKGDIKANLSLNVLSK